jgi:uncharacterized protein with HEPN domain
VNVAADDDRVQRRLSDLAGFGEQAAYIVGKGRDAYLADSPDGALLRNAGERILIKVATVVEKLPEEFRSRYPGVDWSGITRMRNLVAHHYDKVNDDLVWAALTTRLPELLADLGVSAR